MRRTSVLLCLLLTAAAPEPPRVIGSQGVGCIAGAIELPDAGPGWQTVRRPQSAFWGHPAVIAGLQELGRRARDVGLPDLYMGDISGPRGGPLRGGHVSHQMGLDADVYLDLEPRRALSDTERDRIEPPSLVTPDGRGVLADRWRESEVTLLRLAAGLPGVDRVLVNPAIKRQLCRDVVGDRAWLRLIRPWWGHASHMHIHFRCPPDQPLCRDQPPPPPGEGCDAGLQWWFDQLDQPQRPAAPPPPSPAACREILGGAG